MLYSDLQSGAHSAVAHHCPERSARRREPEHLVGASTDPDGNLSGYVLERKVGSGTWAQIYKGSARTYTDTITYGWTSVQYRVKAYRRRRRGERVHHQRHPHRHQ